MVILKIKTPMFLCDGANMNTPAELPARSWIVFDEKITNTGSQSFILHLVKNSTDKKANWVYHVESFLLKHYGYDIDKYIYSCMWLFILGF